LRRQILLQKLARGAFQNVAFADAISLVESFGFSLARVSGSHHVFVHPKIPEVVNLQEIGGEAKPYQLRQVLKLIERYNLKSEGKP
jgi:predicted RNA binding protein YcfA (HicA-like mRNA interferase family)